MSYDNTFQFAGKLSDFYKTDQFSSLPIKFSGGGAFLCFGCDRDAESEFRGEAVGKYRGFLDELFDKSLIKFCDVAGHETKN